MRDQFAQDVVSGRIARGLLIATVEILQKKPQFVPLDEQVGDLLFKHKVALPGELRDIPKGKGITVQSLQQLLDLLE